MKFYTDNMTVSEILNLDYAELSKLDKRDISRALRTLSLAANKRIARLKKYAKKTATGYVPSPSKGKSIDVSALNWVTSDGKKITKFGVKKAKTRNEMLKQISRIRQFFNMQTSTISGSVKLRQKREKNLFGQTREQAAKNIKGIKAKQAFYNKFQKLYNDVWSAYHKFRELEGQNPHAYYQGSDMVISLIYNQLQSNKSIDEAVSNVINEINEDYIKLQAEYNDIIANFDEAGGFTI